MQIKDKNSIGIEGIPFITRFKTLKSFASFEPYFLY